MKISEMKVNKQYLILVSSPDGIFSKGDIIIKNIDNDIVWLRYSGWINITDIPKSVHDRVEIKEI